MRTVAIVFAVILVFLGGIALAALLTGSPGSPSTSPTVSESAAATAPGPSSFGSSVTPTVAPSALPSPTPTAASTPGPSASGSAVRATTVMFRSLKLDARTVAGSEPRLISFATDGPGTVTVKLASVTTGQTTHMCLRLGSKDLICTDKATSTVMGITKQAHAAWRVSLEGNGTDTPTVDLTITFNTIAPKVTVTHARFDGTAAGDYNGIVVAFTPRAAGNATLQASWGGHPFLYEVDLFNETTAQGNTTLANQGPATGTTNSFPVTAGEQWRLVLQNTEAGFGPTDMTATITWP
ncbi:MAG: hypothetical protein ACHQ3P_02200 [Candidatus Limnocylindrales bacterium]